MHKDIDPKDFEGKTIKKLEADAVNIIRFHFTDGTAIAIETEGFGGGLVGMVSCTVCAPSEPHKISEGGTKEAADYWNKRNSMSKWTAKTTRSEAQTHIREILNCGCEGGAIDCSGSRKLSHIPTRHCNCLCHSERRMLEHAIAMDKQR